MCVQYQFMCKYSPWPFRNPYMLVSLNYVFSHKANVSIFAKLSPGGQFSMPDCYWFTLLVRKTDVFTVRETNWRNRSVGFLSERLLLTAGCLVGCLHEFHVARSRQEMCVSHSACPRACAGNNDTFHLYWITITLIRTPAVSKTKYEVSYSWCTWFFLETKDQCK